jgi:hypothetical protein
VKERFDLSNDYLALHYAHQYKNLRFLSDQDKTWMAQLLESTDFKSNTAQANETIARYVRINDVLLDAVRIEKAKEEEKFSNKLDQILTHRVFGYLIFLTLLFLVFQAVFAWASYPMDLIDEGIAGLNGLIQENFSGPLINLLTEGVIAGLGGVLIFIPQIAILFAFIAILEETGYMARVTFMMDKIMRKFGLERQKRGAAYFGRSLCRTSRDVGAHHRELERPHDHDLRDAAHELRGPHTGVHGADRTGSAGSILLWIFESAGYCADGLIPAGLPVGHLLSAVA